MKDKEILNKLSKKINEMGGEIYYVGGCVRDTQLNIPIKDIDVEAHGISKENLEEILKSIGEIDYIGKSFGIYKIKAFNIDISLPRKEIKQGEKHTDFIVEVNPFLGEKNAAKRRDFTINALMKETETGKVLDFFNGVTDLKDGIIRHIDDISFQEDALRVFRACQFAARFNFKIARETLELCKKISLNHLSKERVFDELKKALLMSKRPSIFFENLIEINGLDFWFPELKDTIGVQQHEQKHQEGDVWKHTMMVLNEAAKIRDKSENPLALMLSCLCHDFGKAVCSEKGKEGFTHSYRHEELGLPLIEKFLDRLTNERRLKKLVLNLVSLHQMPNICYNDLSSIKATNKMFDKAISPKDLVLLSSCDNKGKIPQKDIEGFLLDRLNIYNEIMSKPFVQGRDLIARGLKPNKDFSKLLQFANKNRLAGVNKETTLKQTLAYYKELKKNS